jgi:hypothetical protein
MSTVNGIGTRFYGWRPPPCADHGAHATLWFVVFYIPLIPLARHRVKVPTDHAEEGFLCGAVDECEVLGGMPLVWGEVLRTWWAFLRGLLMVVAPFLTCLWISGYQNAQRKHGLPHNSTLGMVASVCLLLSLVAAIALPTSALRRSRG